MNSTVTVKTARLISEAGTGPEITAEVTRVINKSGFGFTVHCYSARSAKGALVGVDAENAIYLAFEMDLRGTTDQQFFEVFYANCPVCGETTEFELSEVTRNDKNARIIHENGGGHHIGELVSSGQYE